jgi:hypothetical protein
MKECSQVVGAQLHRTADRVGRPRTTARRMVLFVLAAVFALSPQAESAPASIAVPTAQGEITLETPTLRPGLLAALQRRASFTRALRGPVATQLEGDADDSSAVAASVYTDERVYSAWHHNGNQIVFAAFSPQGDVVVQPQVVGFGRWPRLASDGKQLAMAWYFADAVLVRTYDGNRWSDGYDLQGSEPALAFGRDGTLYAATTEGLWKLGDEVFERVHEGSYSQPALAIDRQGKPEVAWRKEGHITIGAQDLGEGERATATFGPDGTMHVAYVSKGALIMRSRRDGTWGPPVSIPAKDPKWASFAAGPDDVRLTYLGDADHGPGALWLVRLPDDEPVLMPSLEGNVKEAWLLVSFTLRYDRSHYRPHDVDVLVNGITVGQFKSTVPDGRYLFRLHPAQVFTSFGSPVINRVAIRSRHMNAGHYAVNSDYVLIVRSDWGEKYAFASIASEVLSSQDNSPTNHDQPDLAVLANGLNLPIAMPAPGRIALPVVVANLGEAGSRPAQLRMLEEDKPNGKVLGQVQVPALGAGERVTMTLPLNYDGKLQSVTFRLTQESRDFEPKNDGLSLALWAPKLAPSFGGSGVGGNVQATQTAVARLGSGIRLQLGSWVPKFGYEGNWTAVRAGTPISETVGQSTSDAMPLTPGQYDVYWAQDSDHQSKPMLLAGKVNVEQGRFTTISADSGLRLDEAEWVPAFGYAGYWAAVRSGDALDKRVHWASAADQAILLPTGLYDVYWAQDSDHASTPVLLAAKVDVEQSKLGVVRADSGIRLNTAEWVPQFGYAGYWGVVRAGDAPNERVHWANTTEQALLLPPGEYDVYWAQDSDHWSRALLLAGKVNVEQGNLLPVDARSGMRLDVAEWVPKFGYAGYWGVVRAGDAPDRRVHWTSNRADPLLLPPGRYDIVWVQDSDHPQATLKQAVGVEAGKLLEVEVQPPR